MAKKASRGADAKQPRVISGRERVATAFISALGAMAEKFGVSFAVFTAIVGIVWLFGSEKTRDDFVREALFGQVTHRPFLSIFLLILLLNTVFRFTSWRSGRIDESQEMKRLAAEKSRLQEELAGRPLHHTDGRTTESSEMRARVAPPGESPTTEVGVPPPDTAESSQLEKGGRL